LSHLAAEVQHPCFDARGLERERRKLAERLTTSVAPRVDDVEILSRAEHWAGETRDVLAGSPHECRRMFFSLLEGRRMRVIADDGRVFRVEGAFSLPWMYEAPSESVDSRGGITGSGGPLRHRRTA